MHTYFLFSLPYDVDRWTIAFHLRSYFNVKHVDIFRPRNRFHETHSGACKITLTDEQSFDSDLFSLNPFDVKHIKFNPFNFCIKRWVKPVFVDNTLCDLPVNVLDPAISYESVSLVMGSQTLDNIPQSFIDKVSDNSDKLKQIKNSQERFGMKLLKILQQLEFLKSD